MNTAYHRRPVVALAASAAFGLSLVAFTDAAAADETYNWRFQTLWQAGTANQLAFERFADNVKVMSGGEINITPLPAGAAVGVTEMLDALQGGVLDGYHSAAVYWTGRNPVFAVLGDFNAGYENPYQQVDYFYNYGGMDLLRQAYEPFGVHPIGVALWGVESIPLAKEVGGPDALDGIKLRMPQGMSSDIFASFGAVPINLPGTEVFSAMDNGTIDGGDWGTLSMNAELGFHDIVNYAIYPGIHSMPVGDVVIRKDVWDGLSDRHKRILEIAVRNFSTDMTESLEKQSREYAEKLTAEGVELLDWTPEARAEFRARAREVWEDYAGKNDLSRRAVDSQVDYLTTIGLLESETGAPE